MSLNIIVKGGKRSGGMSGEEMAQYLAKKVDQQAAREKAGYKQRALAARKYGQSVCLILNILKTSQKPIPKQ
jgi:hypothetical protein